MSASIGADPDVSAAPDSVDDPLRWLWLAEAVAEHYGGYSTLRKYISGGRLSTAEKVGGRWRVRKFDLDGLVAQRVRDVSVDEVEAAVAAIVAQAPPLTTEQIRVLGSTFVDQLAKRSTSRGGAA